MRAARYFHPDPPSPHSTANGHAAPTPNHADATQNANRLNLLLSYAGWDQDPWVERLPRLLQPMGIRAVQASSGREAGEVIKATPVHIAVVDLGLPLDPIPQRSPDAPPTSAPSSSAAEPEGGPRLLQLLARLAAPPPTVVIKRRKTSRDDRREIAAALRAGAFAVLDRPRDPNDLELVLEVLQRILKRHYANRWPQS